MNEGWLGFAGGIGLFLFGMMVMTEALTAGLIDPGTVLPAFHRFPYSAQAITSQGLPPSGLNLSPAFSLQPGLNSTWLFTKTPPSRIRTLAPPPVSAIPEALTACASVNPPNNRMVSTGGFMAKSDSHNRKSA